VDNSNRSINIASTATSEEGCPVWGAAGTTPTSHAFQIFQFNSIGREPAISSGEFLGCKIDGSNFEGRHVQI
jgi:hypothetical protein